MAPSSWGNRLRNTTTVSQKHLSIEQINGIHVLRLQSDDGMNRLTTACVLELTNALEALAGHRQALIITGDATGTASHVAAGLRSLRWLMTRQTTPAGLFRPVGTQGFGEQRQEPSAFLVFSMVTMP